MIKFNFYSGLKNFLRNKSENFNSDNICKGEGSFVVISDFHGHEYPLDKIKNYYLNEYDYIYILGDATDRGPNKNGYGSVSLLREIKKLSEMYPQKVIYIPGNHDLFLAGAADNNNYYKACALQNGGSGTLDELQHLRRTDPKEFADLVNWLVNLPLQRVHVYNNKKYVLAHAFFNQRLFDENPMYSLNDFFNTDDPKLKADLYNLLWFRKSDGQYNPSDCPTPDSIMVIGHTPTRFSPGSYDLKNNMGKCIRVYCVDGGISYNDSMLKFDGSRCLTTARYEHVNTSPTKSISEPISNEKILNEYIVKSVFEKGICAFESTEIPDKLSLQECAKVIGSYEGKNGFSYNKCSLSEAYSLYKKTLIFNLILDNLMTKYNDECVVEYFMSGFIFGNDKNVAGASEWITRDGYSRTYAIALGVDNIKTVLAAHNCCSVRQYLDARKDYAEKKYYK